MAMGIDLKKIKYLFYVLIMCIVFFSCNENRKTKEVDISTKTQQFKLIDSGYVEDDYLELIADSNGITSLKVNERLYGNLKMNLPCFFVKNNKNIQTFAYPKIAIKNTVIIVGKTDIESTSLPDLACGNTIQGFLIKKDTMMLIDKIHVGFDICPYSSLDEKVFWTVAHPNS